MFLKKFIVANCQSLIREVFTTSRVYVKPDVGIRATTNQAPLLSSSCCELMSTFLNKTGIQPGNCTLTHSGHKYNPNEPSDCARWPLSQMPDVVTNQMNRVIVTGQDVSKNHWCTKCNEIPFLCGMQEKGDH